MARPKGSFGIPSYRLHRSTGRAVVTIDGKDHYLGAHGTRQTSPESWRTYDRLISEYLHRGRQGPSASDPDTASIDQLLVSFSAHASGRYRGAVPDKFVAAMRWLRAHYGPTLAKDFSPLALQSLRKTMISTPKWGREGEPTLSRGYVNAVIANTVKIFRWAAQNRIVPAPLWMELAAIERLGAGDFGVREMPDVGPVDQEYIDAAIRHTVPTVAAMIRLQLLTGARPGEICSMRAVDIDMSSPVWKYRPIQHKTAHRGKRRTILIGPQGQELLRLFLSPDLTAHVFTPANAWREGVAARRLKIGPTPKKSHDAKRRRERFARPVATSRRYGARYKTGTYHQAIRYACRAATKAARAPDPNAPAVPLWHPHQLRHCAATYMRAEGIPLDVIKTILGHSSTKITDIYAEQDLGAAERAIAKRG